ncbi:hypothetical protein [Brevundimonas sp.]|uniref:hypothetical protein n=1 Tax=Brevundimonas sp. TaxID=1871086 RepID=UPI00289DE3F6|nr:hypothetical protein [Brevundimonas sp.]
MTHHIFFSWQSDTPARVGRGFVETCLNRAIRDIQADADVDPADRDLSVDRDTRDVPGSPPIMETIFGKIDRAAVFVSDLTYVAERMAGGRTPNPNVCIEHGYALKALSWRRVIAVMNTAYGNPDEHELPFDVRHTRRPIAFDLPETADADAKTSVRDDLVRQLKTALRAVFGDEAAKAEMAGPAPEPHPHDLELLARLHRQLPLSLRQFLHQHDFGTPYRMARVDPLLEMNHDWVGAAFEFHDPVVQAAFAEARVSAQALGLLVATRIHAMPNSQEMGWPKTNVDIHQGLQPGTLQVIRDLNARATEFSATLDTLDRIARDRLRVASGAHAAAAADAADAGAAERVLRDAAEAALNELAMDANRGGLPEIVTRPSVTLRLAPYAAGKGERLEPALVSRAQLRFPPNLEERVQTDSDGRQWWSCGMPARVGEAPNAETRWRMRLVRPGYLEYTATIGSRIDDDPDIGVDGLVLEALVVRNLERMASIAVELGLGGPALVAISLDGIEDVHLTRARPGGRRFRRPDLYLPVATLEDLDGPIASRLHEQLDILWQAAGWADGSPSFGQGAWAGYVDERNYPV